MDWLDKIRETSDWNPNQEEISKFIEWKRKKEEILSKRKNLQVKTVKPLPEKSSLYLRKEYISQTLSRLHESGSYSVDDIKRMAYRMIVNWDYDPSDPFLCHWDDKCHPLYALCSEDERDKRFKKVIMDHLYRTHLLKYGKGELEKDIVASRQVCDNGSFKYEDYVLAHICYYYPRCYTNNLRGKTSETIVRQWIMDGRTMPFEVRIKINER